jgi:hypothetical protein
MEKASEASKEEQLRSLVQEELKNGSQIRNANVVCSPSRYGHTSSATKREYDAALLGYGMRPIIDNIQDPESIDVQSARVYVNYNSNIAGTFLVTDKTGNRSAFDYCIYFSVGEKIQWEIEKASAFKALDKAIISADKTRVAEVRTFVKEHITRALRQ